MGSLTKKEKVTRYEAYDLFRHISVGTVVQSKTHGVVTVSEFSLKDSIERMQVRLKSLSGDEEFVVDLTDILGVMVGRETLNDMHKKLGYVERKYSDTDYGFKANFDDGKLPSLGSTTGKGSSQPEARRIY